MQKYDNFLQNISSKQYIIYFLIHTQYTPAKFGDNPSLIILENLQLELQEKTLELLISFLNYTAPLKDIYKNSKILELSDYIALQNILINKSRLFQ